MGDRPKILIVDSRIENIHALEKALAVLDADFVRATSGNKALEILPDYDFALAIVNVKMPVMNGIETVKLIRKNRNANILPILFISAGYSERKLVLEGIKTGAFDFITKPIIHVILKSKVNLFLELYKQRKRLQEEIAKKEQSEKNLQLSDKRFRVIFNQVAIGIAVISIDGRWEQVNKKLCDIFGYTNEELVGQPFIEIRAPEDDNDNFTKIQQLLAGDVDTVWLIMSYINRYGITGWINFTASLIYDSSDNPLYYISLIEDITERKLSEEQLKEASKRLKQKAMELETSIRYKSEFLANMSHELRSPLNSMLILSKILSENKTGNLSGEQVESAEIVNKSGNDLLALINDILDLSKIEAGKMTAYIKDNYPADLVKSTNLSFKHIAEDKGLKLLINVDGGFPGTIRTDQQRLEQIIKNLVSNAIKFTTEGRITVDFHRPVPGTDLSRSGLDPQKAVAVSVTDTGIGIPEDKQMEIFEAFQQADGTTSRKYGGTGLGLSISRELADLLNGEIQLKSTEYEGSTFTVYIPEELTESEAIELDKRSNFRRKNGISFGVAARQKTESEKSEIMENVIDNYGNDFDGKKVLIADDDMRNLYAISKILDERGMDVHKVGNGKMCLNVLEENPDMDIVLIDIMMPVMNGYETMEQIRKLDCFKKLPVLAVTAKAMKGDREKCISAGANDYISKPVEIDRLLSIMQKLLHK